MCKYLTQIFLSSFQIYSVTTITATIHLDIKCFLGIWLHESGALGAFPDGCVTKQITDGTIHFEQAIPPYQMLKL